MARQSDVQLVIRARDEAQRTIKSVAEALELLRSEQDGVAASAGRTGNRLEELQRGLSELESLSRRIAASTDTSSAAINRQAQALLSTNGQITDRKNRVAELTRALDILKTEADKAFIGPQRDGLSQQVKFVQSQLRTATADVSKLTTVFNRQLSGLQSARAAFREIEASQREADAAVSSFTAEIVTQTNALEANTAAAQRAKAAQSFFNNKFAAGLNGAATTVTDREQIASVLRVAEARDIEIQKLRQQEQATAELARTQEAQRRAATLGAGRLAGKSASDSASVFQKADQEAAARFEKQIADNAARLKEMDTAAARLRGELNPLAAIQDHLNQELAEANTLYKAGKISATELAQATALLRKNADNAAKNLGTSGLDSRGRPSLFGLKPYELQNLSFQINDIFTQIASGTSITQTLAQQGGQLLQLFPRVGAGVAAGLSTAPVVAFVVGVGSLVAALKEAVDQAEQLRIFEGALAASADGAQFNAEGLRDSAKELDRFGLSAKDAVAAVRLFVKEGVDPSRITEFGIAAKNLADVLGIDVADAAKQVADAFTGGFEAIDKLDKATNFLTATQREQIRTLFEEGRAAEARTRAYSIFEDRMDNAATKMRGPWTDATRALGNAWDSFMAFMANTRPVIAMAEALERLANGVAGLFNAMSGTTTITDITNKIEASQALVERLEDLNQRLGNAPSRQRIIASEQGKIAELTAELKKLKSASDAVAAGGDTSVQNSERQKKIDEDLRRSDADKLASAKALSNAKRIELAYAEALAAAQEKGASAEAARASAKAAALIEQKKINEEITREREKQKRLEEQAIKSFGQKVIGVESGGNPNAKNPQSTATGLGQFIESTWLRLFRDNFPDDARSMTDAMILALRTDAEISKQMIDVYARQNAERLRDASESVTEANLYLTHFLGPNGALKVIKAAANTPVTALLSKAQINANQSILGDGATAGTVRQFASNKFGEATASEGAIEQRLAELEKERLDTQTRFNEKVKDENEKRRLAVSALESQRGLIGEALLAEQKKQAIAEALLQKQQEIDKINEGLRAKGLQEIPFTEELRGEVVKTTAAYFDAAHAKDIWLARRQSVDQPVEDFTALRDSLQAQIQFLQETGQTALANQLQPQLDVVNARLAEAIENAKELYATLASNPEALAALGATREQIEAIQVKLDTTALTARQFGYFMGISGRQIGQSFAQHATAGLDRFAQAVANGRNVFSSLKDAFLQFAADFLRQIVQMIQQQIIFNLVSSALSGAFGGSTSTAGGSGGGNALAGLRAHDGGIIGGTGPQKISVLPQWFQNAARYHTGGIAGLRPNEIPAILEEGEEVLTRGDPRHIMNGGGAGGRAPDIKVINAIDAGDFVSKGLNTKTGERAILNFIRANPGAVKSAMGG